MRSDSYLFLKIDSGVVFIWEDSLSNQGGLVKIILFFELLLLIIDPIFIPHR
jgi:hypothetical protein